jgi:hypothetical protein
MNIPKDKMSPLERVGAFLSGKPMDRVPAAPSPAGDHAPHRRGAVREEHQYDSASLGKRRALTSAT